jgi:hypothetical protein
MVYVLKQLFTSFTIPVTCFMIMVMGNGMKMENSLQTSPISFAQQTE